MATVATRLMTAVEFYDFANRPENRDRHFELEEGEIVEMSRPGESHCAVCGNVTWILGTFTRQRKQGHVCPNDMGFVVGRGPDTVRGPDVALYLDARKYDELAVKWPEQVPTLIIEVLSPNDTLGKIMNRVRQFIARGVAVAWIVDPEQRNVWVCRPNELPVVLEKHEELSSGEVLPELRCMVADFFMLPGEA